MVGTGGNGIAVDKAGPCDLHSYDVGTAHLGKGDHVPATTILSLLRMVTVNVSVVSH